MILVKILVIVYWILICLGVDSNLFGKKNYKKLENLFLKITDYRLLIVIQIKRIRILNLLVLGVVIKRKIMIQILPCVNV